MSSRQDLVVKRAEFKEEIHQAAILEFSENGLRGASTQGIADRAGISKTKLHYYISSKEELYQEVLNKIVGTWEAIYAGVSLENGPEAFFRDYIVRKVRYSLERPAEVRLFVHEVMSGAKQLRNHWMGSREATRRAAAQITKWIDRGQIREVHPILLQFHIWALTEQYAVLAEEAKFMLGQTSEEPLDAEMIINEISFLIINGLRP